MKKILLGTIVTLLSVNSFAMGVYPIGLGIHDLQTTYLSDEERVKTVGMLSSTSGVTTSSTAAHPLLGLIAMLDNGEMALDMENEELLDELDLIELKISEGEELTDRQKAIIEIGELNNQL